jgi:regulator of sigma D
MHRPRTLILTALLVVAVSGNARAQELDDLALMQSFLDLMSQYFAIIESTHDITSDAEKAAIMQMQKIQEVYEERGDKARSVVVLKKVLDESDNRAIRNAAYLMLGDTLKESGQASEAIAVLERGLKENIEAAD